jgi:hypothetical protein
MGSKIPVWKLFEPLHKQYLKSGCAYFVEYLKSLDLGIEMHNEHTNGDRSTMLETYSIKDPEKYFLAKIKHGF